MAVGSRGFLNRREIRGADTSRLLPEVPHVTAAQLTSRNPDFLASRILWSDLPLGSGPSPLLTNTFTQITQQPLIRIICQLAYFNFAMVGRGPSRRLQKKPPETDEISKRACTRSTRLLENFNPD